mgnify:CR=1 FL=1|jgi:hypothetical protein
MITKQQFDELVTNCERIMTQQARQIADLEARLAVIENRSKPGPKPKQKAA